MALLLVLKTASARLTKSLILKAVDPAELLRGGWDPADCVLLADLLPLETKAQILAMPWGAVMSSDPIDGPWPWVQHPSPVAAVSVGDVIDVGSQSATLRVLYRRGEKGNALFATEQCNSYCLMCSQPPRIVNDAWRVATNLRLISLIDKNESSLAISGGEPTLLGSQLATLISACAVTLPGTDLQILSNGRAFADPWIAAAILRNDHPKLQWNIPLYADVASVHDYVVQSRGAFDETLAGLYRLAERDQAIEIRVVLNRPTIPRLLALSEFIYRNLSFVRHIALMGMEPVGFAKGNWNSLWIDPVDYQAELGAAVEHLSARGFAISIYNLPLCVLTPSLWAFSRQSISDWKNVYLDCCASCALQSRCGGFFASTQPKWTSRGVRSFPAMDIGEGHVA